MSFWDRMQEIINQGLDSTKEALEKAKGKAKDLGEMGVLKFEIMQLEKQAEKQFARLGARVYEKLVQEGQDSASRELLADPLKSIGDLKSRIEQREKALRRLEDKRP